MTKPPTYYHIRAVAAAKTAYAVARTNPNQWEGLEAMRAINDFLVAAAVQEAEDATGRRPLDLARQLQ